MSFWAGLFFSYISILLSQLLNDGLSGWAVSFFLDGLYPVVWALYAQSVAKGLLAVIFLGACQEAMCPFVPKGILIGLYVVIFVATLIIRQHMRIQFPFTSFLIQGGNFFIYLSLTIVMCIQGASLCWGRFFVDLVLSQLLLWFWAFAFCDTVATLENDDKLSLRWI